MTETKEPAVLTPGDIPRRPRRKRRTARSLLILVTVVLVGNAIVGERGLLALLKSQRDMVRLSGVILSLRAENDRFRERVRELKEEPRMIEEVARGELGLIGIGEVLFIVTDGAPVIVGVDDEPVTSPGDGDLLVEQAADE